MSNQQDNDNNGIKPEAILRSHQKSTIERMSNFLLFRPKTLRRGEASEQNFRKGLPACACRTQTGRNNKHNKSLVLAIQDTTELDYTHHPATKGLGTLHDTNHQGLVVHTTLAVTPGRVPLGIIQQQVWTRPLDEFGKKHMFVPCARQCFYCKSS